MRRVLPLVLGAAVLLVLFTGIASAAVHVNVAVNPTTIPQCTQANILLALSNDGTAPILARVCFSLSRNDSVLFGPICGRVPLAAGERRSHEFTFFVPPVVPPGNYAILVGAHGSDGSSDQSSAAFSIVPRTGMCIPPPPTGAMTGDPTADLLNSVIQGAGISPDQPTTVREGTWGQLKLIYH